MVKTLFVGLGGLGCRVLKQLAAAEHKEHCGFLVLDRSAIDCEELTGHTEIPCIHLGGMQKVGECLERNAPQYGTDWFPLTPMIAQEVVAESPHRFAAMLAFLDAQNSGTLGQFVDEAVGALLGGAEEVTGLQVVVITSLAGATGSAIHLPFALWVRDRIRATFGREVTLCGYFALPELYLNTFRDTQCVSNYLQAFAHASLLELQAFDSYLKGEATDAQKRICEEGVLASLAKPHGTSVYDSIAFYEPASSADKFDAHIGRIAQTVWTRYASPLSRHIAPPHGVAVPAVSVARVPSEELNRYCTLRGAYETVRERLDFAQDLACGSPRVSADVWLERADHLLLDELCSEDAFADMPNLLADCIDVRDIPELIHETLRKLRLGQKRLHSAVSDAAHRVYRSLLYGKDGQGSPLLALLEEPRGAYCLLREIRQLLSHTYGRIPTLATESLFDACPVPFALGKKDIQPSDATEFALVVWEQNRFTRMMHKNFCPMYLAWLEKYCNYYAGYFLQEALACAKRELYPLLIVLTEELCDGMQQLARKLEEPLRRALAEYETRPAETDRLTVGMTAPMRERLFGELSCADAFAEADQAFLGYVWAQVVDSRVGFVSDARASLTPAEVCKKLIACVRGSVMESADLFLPELIGMLLAEHHTETVPEQERQDYENSLIKGFVSRLYTLAGENLQACCPSSCRNAVAGYPTHSALALSANCPHAATVCEAAEELHITHTACSREVEKTELLCLRELCGISLRDVASQYAEAYAYFCRGGRLGWRSYLTPHVDMRFDGVWE